MHLVGRQDSPIGFTEKKLDLDIRVLDKRGKANLKRYWKWIVREDGDGELIDVYIGLSF